jgi:hypothetical protein
MRLICPACGSSLFTLHSVGLVRRRCWLKPWTHHWFPQMTCMRGDISCDRCGSATSLEKIEEVSK